MLQTKVYSTFTSPLSKIPGPTTSKWTRLRLKYEILKGNRMHYVHALHQQYGPIVRISPEEVSLADTQAVKTIYRVGGPYLKTPWYKAFTGSRAYEGLFTLRNKDVHNHNRKLQSHHFSEKWIKTMEPFIIANVQRAIERMREDVERKGWSDVLQWYTFMATDVIGEASFGDSFRMLETGKVGKATFTHTDDGPDSSGRKINTPMILKWSPIEVLSGLNSTALCISCPTSPSVRASRSAGPSNV